MVRRVWGVYGQNAEYVYVPATSKDRTPNMHRLDITELGVQLVENHVRQVSELVTANTQVYVYSCIFDPEPWSHVQVGRMTLKPDAYTDLGTMRYFIEMDRDTEHPSILSQKMRRYVSAYEQWDDPTFPLCVWVVHNADRKRTMDNVIRRQTLPALFACVLFDEAASYLTKG
jgi:Replication-relaxation